MLKSYGATFLITAFAIVIISLLIFVIVKIMRRCKLSPKNQRRVQKLSSLVFYNPLIRFIMLYSMKLNVTSLMAIKRWQMIDLGEKFTATLSLAFLFVFPVICAKFLHKNAKELHKEANVQKFGSLYGGRNVDAKKQHKVWVLPLAYFFRRSVFMVATVYLRTSPSLQVIVHQVLILLTLAYLIRDKHRFTS